MSLHILMCTQNFEKIRDGHFQFFQKVADFTWNDPIILPYVGFLAGSEPVMLAWVIGDQTSLVSPTNFAPFAPLTAWTCR